MNTIINKKIRKFRRRKIFSDLKKDKRDGCDAVKKKPLKINGLEVAGEPGLEPRLTESESAVLPLNYSPMTNL